MKIDHSFTISTVPTTLTLLSWVGFAIFHRFAFLHLPTFGVAHQKKTLKVKYWISSTFNYRGSILGEIAPQRYKWYFWYFSHLSLFLLYFPFTSSSCPNDCNRYRGGVRPMRPKTRGLTQHGCPPGWLEKSVLLYVMDSQSKPPALTDGPPIGPVRGTY